MAEIIQFTDILKKKIKKTENERDALRIENLEFSRELEDFLKESEREINEWLHMED